MGEGNRIEIETRNSQTIILDVLTKHIQELMPCAYILFRDDVVLMGELREEINTKLEWWRQALENHMAHVSRSKTGYVKCKFSKRCTNPNLEVNIGDDTIPQLI